MLGKTFNKELLYSVAQMNESLFMFFFLLLLFVGSFKDFQANNSLSLSHTHLHNFSKKFELSENIGDIITHPYALLVIPKLHTLFFQKKKFISLQASRFFFVFAVVACFSSTRISFSHLNRTRRFITSETFRVELASVADCSFI